MAFTRRAASRKGRNRARARSRARWLGGLWRLLAACLCCHGAFFTRVAAQGRPPNLVVVMGDDVGYSDLEAYGGTLARTPSLNQMAAEGIVFTDAYAPASTCSPTRYSFVTGEYAWRSTSGSGIIGPTAPLAIRPATRPTLARVMQQLGYRTAIIGKWHLGLGDPPATDFNARPIKPGPLDLGFDVFFGIPSTNDRVPSVYIDDDHVFLLDPSDPIYIGEQARIRGEPQASHAAAGMLKYPADSQHSGTVVNGISRIGLMAGGQAARWRDEDVPDELLRRAGAFMQDAVQRQQPFFLFYSSLDIHVPRYPKQQFRNQRPGCGHRCGTMEQLDWQLGELIKQVDALGQGNNTLVIFSSDNGPILNDGYIDQAAVNYANHRTAGPFSGGKYDIQEGGTRVPLITRWTGTIAGGQRSSALVSLIDILASGAALAGVQRPADAGPDSFNVLEALMGLSQVSTRDHIVTNTNAGRMLGIRQGDWKLTASVNQSNGQLQSPKLYNLVNDVPERMDLAGVNANKLNELLALLDKLRNDGKSPRRGNEGFVYTRPGPLPPPPLPTAGAGGAPAPPVAGAGGGLAPPVAGIGGASGMTAPNPPLGPMQPSPGGTAGGGLAPAPPPEPSRPPAARRGCACLIAGEQAGRGSGTGPALLLLVCGAGVLLARRRRRLRERDLPARR